MPLLSFSRPRATHDHGSCATVRPMCFSQFSTACHTWLTRDCAQTRGHATLRTAQSKRREPKSKRANKTHSTGPSHVVPHHSTTPARASLTSLFGWEAVILACMAVCAAENVGRAAPLSWRCAPKIDGSWAASRLRLQLPPYPAGGRAIRAASWPAIAPAAQELSAQQLRSCPPQQLLSCTPQLSSCAVPDRSHDPKGHVTRHVTVTW